MKKGIGSSILVMVMFLWLRPGMAHYGMVIVSDSMVTQEDDRAVSVTLSFSHPFEGIGMELVKPADFGVMSDGKKQDLLSFLNKTQVMGHTAWTADYRIQRPGTYSFYMEPVPYWEPIEDCYIVHYTKTVTAAFGEDDGWDEPVGLKAEIIPLSRPYGLYAGNVFQGKVLVEGKPLPDATVEVEYYNRKGRYKAATDYLITQRVKTDANGIFAYAAPAAGWWGFAALTTADKTMPYDGEEKEVEIGAVLWVEFHEFGK
ncbi:MAG: DUF4198 domain-containing protein [Desulfobacterales bacterium]